MKAKIILNPYANRWGAQAQMPAIEAACREAGLDFDLTVIKAPGYGKDEAQSAVADGYDAIVAAGGDGTVNEVVNGLIAAAGEGPTHPLGVIPVGTGNDFNDMAKIPRDLLAAAKTIVDGKTRQVDAGRVIADGRHHYFGNNCALAMEPMVTIENIRMTRLSGNIRYIVALMKALANLKAWHMRFTWDEGEFDGPIFLLSVCNGMRTGGVFKMAPHARTDDGLLDIVFAPKIPKATLWSLVPRLLRGTHIHHPSITYGRTRKLAIESEPGTPIHADGEVITESARQISYDILPGKITLITP